MKHPSRLEERRRATRTTLRQVAAKIGLSYESVRRIERGQQPLRPDLRARYAEALGVSEATLRRYLRELESQNRTEAQNGAV